MKDKLLENINELFDSYNLFAGNRKKNIDKMKQMMPDITEEDIKEYVLLCQEKYPEIDEKHIRELFSTICWLTNR